MQIVVSDSSLVGEARRTATELAAIAGFDAEKLGRIGLAATEIATNIIKHADQGTIAIENYSDAQGAGIEIVAFDHGPGIADIPRALCDGYSTAGSPGTGLGAIRRQADHFDMFSRPGSGTALMARFARSASKQGRRGAVIGMITCPYPGETENGDAWAYKESGSLRRVMVADGSGHGRAAAVAAQAAAESFAQDGDVTGHQLMDRIHRALLQTRGAAVAIAGYRPEEKQVRLVGVGNIAASLVDGGNAKQMVSHNGTAGQLSPRIREFTYPIATPPLIILHSDGISAKWNLDSYPGLAAAHPSLVAAVLFRDFKRGRDDTIALAVRMLS